MEKNTIQELASALGVSRVTIWKVLNNRPGVSDGMRRRVSSAAAEMRLRPSAAPQGQNVALVVARPESSRFWMKIINQVAAELSARRLNLIYINLTMGDLEHFQLPPVIEGGGVRGFLVINAYDERVMRLMASSPVPKVFLDGVPGLPLEKMNGDVLLLDGRDSVRAITRRLLEHGRARLGFAGDIQYARTNYLRWQGFLDAHEERGLSPDAALSLTGSIGVNAYRTAVARYLDALPTLPDGIVCANDYIAQLVLQRLEERGARVPEDVAVSGYDDDAEFHPLAGRLTTVHVQNEQIGRRLVHQLLYRMENPQADYEVISMHSRVLPRASTALP